MKPEHRLLTYLFKYCAEEQGFSTDIECLTIKGVKPDLRITHPDYYPIHLEVESKGDGFHYNIKREKTDKAHAILLFVDLRNFEFESRTVKWIMEQIEFAFEQAKVRAEAPVCKIKYTVPMKFLDNLVIGHEYERPEREVRYRFFHSKIGKLAEIEKLIDGSWELVSYGRITGVEKRKKEKLKGELFREYMEGIAGHDKNDREKNEICVVYWECEEILKEE